MQFVNLGLVGVDDPRLIASVSVVAGHRTASAFDGSQAHV
jgi:hypothetical protein